MVAPPPKDSPSAQPALWSVGLELLGIVILFYLFAGYEPPGVNEAHYLTKAKHYWNPQWCAGDRFLESADAHAVFFWTFGWITRYVSLSEAAWWGRAVCWLLLAWSWRRLSYAVVPRVGFAILSAGLFLLFIKQYAMAGEWVVGGVEAKCFAYVFVLLGLEGIARNRWQWVFPLCGAAAAFHVIVGGWAVLIAFGVWCLLQLTRQKADDSLPSFLQLLPALILGFVLSLPGLLPCVLLNRGTDPAIIAEGNVIYVYQRLKHHLVLHSFQPSKIYQAWWGSTYIARHALLMLGLVGLTGIVTQVRPLWRVTLFAWGCIVLVICGAVIDLISTAIPREQSAAVLRFYWFRMSDAMVPVGVALAITWWIAVGIQGPRWRAIAMGLAILASGFNLAEIVAQRTRLQVLEGDVQSSLREIAETKGAFNPRERLLNWQACCRWIREHTEEDAVFITTKGLPQTFLWYAERAEVASWKNAPQDAQGLVDWMRRIEDIHYDVEFLQPPSIDKSLLPEKRWPAVGAKYGARYLVGKIKKGQPPLGLERVYPNADFDNSSFAVYRLPDWDVEELEVPVWEGAGDAQP
jgi:hypothetical protein